MSQPLEIQIRLANGARVITVAADTPKELFEKMAMAHEVFSETACGLCGSANIRPAHRITGGFRFYEYHCQEPGCLAHLSLGQINDNTGTLFPVRKLLPSGKPCFKHGHHGPHRGWTTYRGEPNE